MTHQATEGERAGREILARLSDIDRARQLAGLGFVAVFALGAVAGSIGTVSAMIFLGWLVH